MSRGKKEGVHFSTHPISFTSVPAWLRSIFLSVNFLFHHRNVQKDCFRWFRLFGHPKIFCVNGLWKGHFHDKTDRRNPISILTRLFVCQKRALRTASLLLGKVCDLDGISCSAVGHSRTHFYFLRTNPIHSICYSLINVLFWQNIIIKGLDNRRKIWYYYFVEYEPMRWATWLFLM